MHERYVNDELLKSFDERILIGSSHYQIDTARQFLEFFRQTFTMVTVRARLYYLPENLPVTILISTDEAEQGLAAFAFVVTTHVLV